VIWDYGYIPCPRNRFAADKPKRGGNTWARVKSQRQWAHFPVSMERFQMALELSSDDQFSVTLRFPEYNYAHPDWGLALSFRDGMAPDSDKTDVSMWHQDYKPWGHIAMWSTNGSTEVLTPDGWIHKPPVRHLIVIDNQECFHRTGRDVNLETRIFVRAGIYDFEPLDKYQVA
jgi:hypothetical protein